MSQIPLTTLGENIERIRKERGITIAVLCERANVGRATLHRIKIGESPEPRSLFRIADALGCTFDELLSKQFVTYTLATAPLCTEKYLLKLQNSKALGIPNFPVGEVTVEVVPYKKAPKEPSIRLLYRYDGETMALIVEARPVGDKSLLIPVGLQGQIPAESLPSVDNGQILGAIYDITSLRHIFVPS